MQKAETSTGIKMLDSDLAELFKLEEQGKLSEAKQLLEDLEVTQDKFTSLISMKVARVTIALLDKDTFVSLKERSAQDSHGLLDKAREIAQTFLAKLPDHPVAKKILVDEAGEEEKDDNKEGKLTLNVISQLAPFSSFFYYREKLIPAVRITFLDRREKKLLESTMDWDDLLFLINGLICIAEAEFEKSIKFFDLDILDIPGKTKIGIWISSIEEHLQKLKELSAPYKLGEQENEGQKK